MTEGSRVRDLKPNEKRHAESLEEIRKSPFFSAECGSSDYLGKEPRALLPLSRRNGGRDEPIFDDDLLGCALRFTDLGARWETTGRAGSPRIRGEFNLLHLEDVLGQSEGPAAITGATDFQTRFLSELRVIDHTPRSGAGMLTYIRLQPGKSPLEIWYSDIADIGEDPYPPGFVRMDITYCQYLDALVVTKGTYGWQYLYTDVSLRRGGFRETVTYLRGMLQTFPELFPRYEYAPLRARLEARL
jgi:hypothetical protein